MNPSFLVLLGFLLGGGSGDLLDYVPTQGYWQSQSVAVTVDSMLHEAAADPPVDAGNLIADLAAADPQARDAASEKIVALGPAVLPQLADAAHGTVPEVAERAQMLIERLQALVKQRSVRRLMAIRALGELKDAKALAFLQSASVSNKEMFVGDYANVALGQITGHPTTQPSRAAARDDVWLLPADCAAVFQLVPRGHGPMELEKALANVPLRADQDRARIARELWTLELGIAEQIGDVRLDAMSVGISQNMDGNQGFVVLIASGQFDSAAAIDFGRRARIARKSVNGVDVFEPDGDAAMFFPSDHRLVMLASPQQEQYPLKQMILAVKNDKPMLKDSAEMTRLINSIAPPPAGATRALWAAVKVTDAYRQIPGLDGFQTVTLSGDALPGALQLSAHGQSVDAETAHAAQEEIQRELAEAVALLKAGEAFDPIAKGAETFAGTVRLQNDGNLLGATGTLEESPATLLMLPVLFGADFHVTSP